MHRGLTHWRFALLYAKCDEEVRCNEFGFAHYWAGNEVCSECLGNRAGKPFPDLRAEAAWRPSANMSLEVYRSRAREPRRPLVASPVFVSGFILS